MRRSTADEAWRPQERRDQSGVTVGIRPSSIISDYIRFYQIMSEYIQSDRSEIKGVRAQPNGPEYIEGEGQCPVNLPAQEIVGIDTVWPRLPNFGILSLRWALRLVPEAWF